MGRRTASTTFVTPYTAAGALQSPGAAELGYGTFTLAPNTTYYFPLGGQDALMLSAQLQHDASLVVTLAQVEDTNLSEKEASAYSQTAGHWFAENPPDAYVPVAGGAGNVATGALYAADGTSAGGAKWDLVDAAAARFRLRVDTGAMGGEARVIVWGKE